MALVIAGVLGGGLTLAFRTALDADQRVYRRSDVAQEVRIVLNALRADLEHAALSPGSERSWFIGTDENDGDRDVDSLRLITRSRRVPLRALSTETEWETMPRYADWSAVTYSLTPSGTSEEGGLFRREQVPPGTDPFEEVGEEECLSPMVVAFNCRYHDGTDWLDSWDTTAEPETATLPRLVEVTLTFRPDPESEETVTATATFILRNRPQRASQETAETEGTLGLVEGGTSTSGPGAGAGAFALPGRP